MPIAQSRAAASGNENVAGRVDDPEQGDAAQSFLRLKRGAVGKAGAGDGGEEVDGDGINSALSQGKGEFHPLPAGFSHAEYPSGADLHPRRTGVPQAFDIVIVGMGRTYFGKERSGGFEVVVVPRHARSMIPFCLDWAEHAQGIADTDPDLPAYAFCSIAEQLHVFFVKSGAACDDAEAFRSRTGGTFGALDESRFVSEGVYRGIGLVMCRLGAESAVFLAAAGFSVDDAAV